MRSENSLMDTLTRYHNIYDFAKIGSPFLRYDLDIIINSVYVKYFLYYLYFVNHIHSPYSHIPKILSTMMRGSKICG